MNRKPSISSSVRGGLSSWVWLVPALLIFATSPVSAAAPPYLREHFNDLAGKIPDDYDNSIESKLATASTASSTQLVIVVINRFADYPGMPTNATDFARQLHSEWKLGSGKQHRAVLALFSLGDKQYQVAQSQNMPAGLTARMVGSIKGEVTLALRDGNLGEAMDRCADILIRETPKPDSPGQASAPPVSTNGQRAETHQRKNSETGIGIGALVVGGIILLVIIIAVVSAFSRRSAGYGYGGYGGYGPAPYYGGYGDGGGNFFTGMLVGGMMNNMFGGGHSHYGGSHSSGSSTGYSDSGGNSSWGSWGGGESSGGSWDSGSSWSSGGDSSSFGGSDWGGSSGGEW